MEPIQWANLVSMQRSYALGETRPRAGPREAYIEVAARCNLRCVMCPITVDPRYAPGSGRTSLLSPELFERIMSVAPTLQRAHLFGLGEPLLNPHLFELAERLAAAGVEVWTTTNATLIGPEVAERFADAGFSRVSVSIDGATEETYERIRLRGRFEDARRGLAALGEVRRRRGRPEVTLSMVGMVSNLEEVPRLVELAAEVGADAAFLEELYGWAHPALQEVYRRETLANLPPERVRGLVEAARRRAGELGVAFTSRLEERPAPPTAEAPPTEPAAAAPAADAPAPDPLAGSDLAIPWPCSEPWSTVNVNASGEVRTCCFNDTVLGDLSEASLEEIWRGPAYATLRRHLAGGSSVASCDACVRAGRMKRSPYLALPVGTEAPETPPTGFRLEAPGDGETVVDPLVLAGRLDFPEPRPVRAARRLLRRLGRWGVPLTGHLERRLFGGERHPVVPDVYLDDYRFPRQPDWTVVDGDRFALVLPIEFVSAGSYVLRVAAPQEAGGATWARRTVLVGGPAEAPGTVTGCRRVAVTVDLDHRSGAPRLVLDGRLRRLSGWVCGARQAGWKGVAVISLDGLDTGLLQAELRFPGGRPHRFTVRHLALP